MANGNRTLNFKRRAGRHKLRQVRRMNMKMKIADMTERQKKAYRNIIGAANDFIGGLENTMEDSPEDSEEYINAKETLDNHDELVDFIYQD